MTVFLGIGMREFDFLNPTPDMIDIGDIAHALAGMPRFTGHTTRPYSVLQHSLLVAELVTIMGHGKYRLHALLHDAAEAYIGDASRPFKEAMRMMTANWAGPHLTDVIMSDFDLIEQKINNAIRDKWNLRTDGDILDIIKRADDYAYVFEVPAVLTPAHLDHPLWAWVKELEPVVISPNQQTWLQWILNDAARWDTSRLYRQEFDRALHEWKQAA